MKGFEVIQSGPLSLIQDAGRFAYQHLGVSPSGPMDIQAAAWANHLLGNAWGAPLLEVSLGGLKLKAQQNTWLAVCGAEVSLSLDAQPCPLWQSFPVRAEQVLKLGYARSGTRAYLAVAGGFQVKQQLGSVATQVREGLGGLDGLGAPLRQGDVLPCHPAQKAFRQAVPACYVPDYKDPPRLRLVLAEGEKAFQAEAYASFFEQTWRVSPQSDRMGIRLQGAALPAPRGSWSSPVVTGSVQVPADGQPIVLAADRQTLGGYPVLGWVHPLDLGRLAQLPARSALHFQVADLADVQHELRTFYQFFGRS